jgi:hypothetical protein
MKGGRPANDELPRRAVDPEWGDLLELRQKLASLPIDEFEAVLRRAGVWIPPRRVQSSPAAAPATGTMAAGGEAA